MADDAVDPLCSVEDFTAGGFADLARTFSAPYLLSVMVEASRACETEADRRFLPFTATESHRADGVDPDELASQTGMQLDLQAANGVSYANAMGGGIGSLVRKVWLHEHAARFTEMWTYNPTVTIGVLGSAGDAQSGVTALFGPDPASGLVWLPIGVYAPIGSLVQITYSGGYSTIPADLRRACKYMAASILVRELDPTDNGHDPGSLEALAVASLTPYRRA